MLARISLLALCLTSSIATAQTTWIVAAGGGGNFTDLPPAIAAAQPGDTVLVRAGSYNRVTVSRGIALIGQGGAFLPTATPAVTVTGLPAGQTFLWRGMDLSSSTAAEDIVVSACQGHVVIHTVSVRGAVRIETSSQVSLHALDAPKGVRITDSTALLTQCSIQLGLSSTQSIHAVVVERSTVTVAHSDAKGSFDLGLTAAGAGIELRSGTLTVTGDASTTIAAGQRGMSGLTAAIRTLAGTLIIDPLVHLVPNPGAPPISGPASVQTRNVPALRSLLLSGNVLATTARSLPGENVWIFAGLPLQPTLSLPIGTLWLDPAILILLGSGVFGANGQFAASTNLPPLPPGVLIALQGLVLSGSTLTLTTPVVRTADGG